MKKLWKKTIVLLTALFLLVVMCGCVRVNVSLKNDGTGTATVMVAAEEKSKEEIQAELDKILAGVDAVSGEKDRLKLSEITETEEGYRLEFTFKQISKLGGLGNFTFKPSTEFIEATENKYMLSNWNKGKLPRGIELYDRSTYNLTNNAGKVSVSPVNVKSGETVSVDDFLASEEFTGEKSMLFTFAMVNLPGVAEIEINFKGKILYASDCGVEITGDKSVKLTPIKVNSISYYFDENGQTQMDTSEKDAFVGYVLIQKDVNVAGLVALILGGILLVGGISFGIYSGVFKRWYRRNEKTLKLIRHNYGLYIMILPATVLFLIFSYAPMVGLIVAFKDYTVEGGIFGSEWVGLKHFITAITHQGSGFWGLFRNTFVLALLKFIFGFPASIILALMFNRLTNGIFKKTVQTISYLPYFVSWIVLSGMCYLLLATDGGIINNTLISLNMQPVKFYDSPQYWWGILTASSVWKNVGWGTIVYLAALTSIDTDLYEAADIDGANGWYKLWSVTIPGMMPVIGIQLILSMGSLIKDDFDQIYAMVGGENYALRDVTEVFSSLIFRQLQAGPAGYSPSTAVGLIQSLLSLGLVLVANHIVRKTDNPGLW